MSMSIKREKGIRGQCIIIHHQYPFTATEVDLRDQTVLKADITNLQQQTKLLLSLIYYYLELFMNQLLSHKNN